MGNLTLIIVIALLTLIAFYKGRYALYLLLVSYFPAAAMYSAFVDWPISRQFITSTFFNGNFSGRLLVFIIFFAIALLAMRKIIRYEGLRFGTKAVIDSGILAVGLACESLALTFHVLPDRDIYHLSAGLENYFNSPSGYFLLIMIPVLGILYSARE